MDQIEKKCGCVDVKHLSLVTLIICLDHIYTPQNTFSDGDRILREEVDMNYVPELPDGLEMIQPDEDELKDIRYTAKQ